MKISRDQYQALSQIPRAEFLRSMTAFLREQFEDGRAMPENELHTLVAQCTRRAEIYGLRSGQSAASFVLTAYLLGTNFDREFPAVPNVLLSPVLQPADKAQWLQEWTMELFRTLESRK